MPVDRNGMVSTDAQLPCVLGLRGSEGAAAALAAAMGGQAVGVESRRFPDGELYLRVAQPVAGRDAVIVGQIQQPDEQLIALVFLADALRDLGARSVGLVLPYLPYMRQDARFQPGEAITSRSCARLLSACADWLVTVDPHLHRYPSLDAVYTLRSEVVASAEAIARWIEQHVVRPMIFGPDEESEQWVAEVAALAGCPWRVMRKSRHGDRDVDVEAAGWQPDEAWQGRTPVLLDDIVSSGHTMRAAVERLAGLGWPGAVCIAVHGVHADSTRQMLLDAGASTLVTCNTLPVAGPQIDLWPHLARAASRMLAR